VVTFGAFVEILPGVEGLVHISELAQHHVENPREVVSQGDPVKVLILEVDGERRRLSLSLKRVEDNQPVGEAPDLGLSEEVFAPRAEAEASPEETYEAPDDGAAAGDSEEVPSEEEPQTQAP
jgi:small subunit ribosomal protein S1